MYRKIIHNPQDNGRGLLVLKIVVHLKNFFPILSVCEHRFIGSLDINQYICWINGWGFVHLGMIELVQKQIERKTELLKNLKMPPKGWIRLIREALGMTKIQLAKKCEVTAERIRRIEMDETLQKVTLKTLQRAANSMDCKLVYGFVPHQKLSTMISKQAELKAKRIAEHVNHTMDLENQKTTPKELQEQIQLIKQELLNGPVKKIWNNEI